MTWTQSGELNDDDDDNENYYGELNDNDNDDDDDDDDDNDDDENYYGDMDRECGDGLNVTLITCISNI